VRELEHMVERFCLLGGNVESLFSPQLGKSTQASSDFLGEEVFDNPKPLKVAAQKAKVRAEREVLLKALKMCDNDYAQTAKKLNICLASLYNKIKDYGVNV
jgi:DNA-binding NtrC family response regulator